MRSRYPCRDRLLCDGTNLSGGEEFKWKRDSGVSKAVTLAASSKVNCLPLISSLREHGIVRTARARKLFSAHVPSHCNLALQSLRIWTDYSQRKVKYEAEWQMNLMKGFLRVCPNLE
jgi:hypothetical protein